MTKPNKAVKQLVVERGSTNFLRLAITGIGLLTLLACVWALPAGIMDDNTGMYKPILVGMYVPAIPFFFALYQAWKLLGLIDRSEAFSEGSVQAVRNIKFCAGAICALYALGFPYIFHVADRDDAPGVVAITLGIIGSTFVIATFAAVFQKLLQNAVDIKRENDLTV